MRAENTHDVGNYSGCGESKVRREDGQKLQLTCSREMNSGDDI